MKRLALLPLIAFALVGAACAPVKSPPPGEHTECVTGVQNVINRRPDLNLVQYQCADFGDTYWVGLYTHYGPNDPRNNIKISEHFRWYDCCSSPESGYYGVAAHENGHAWDFGRLDDSQRNLFGQIMGGGFDREQYAEVFAVIVYGKASGSQHPSWPQIGAICDWGLMPC